MKHIAQALLKVQHEISPAIKDAKNGHLQSKYATLSSVWDAIAPALKANGVLVIQQPEMSGGTPVLETLLIHAESGESVSSHLPLVMERQTPHALGSALTYARRYSLCAMLGVMTDDDDGEQAMGRNKPPSPAPKAPEKAPSGPQKPREPEFGDGLPDKAPKAPEGPAGLADTLAKATTRAEVQSLYAQWKLTASAQDRSKGIRVYSHFLSQHGA